MSYRISSPAFLSSRSLGDLGSFSAGGSSNTLPPDLDAPNLWKSFKALIKGSTQENTDTSAQSGIPGSESADANNVDQETVDVAMAAALQPNVHPMFGGVSMRDELLDYSDPDSRSISEVHFHLDSDGPISSKSIPQPTAPASAYQSLIPPRALISSASGDLSSYPPAVRSVLDILGDSSDTPFPADFISRLDSLDDSLMQQVVQGMNHTRLQHSIRKFNALLEPSARFKPHDLSFHHLSYSTPDGESGLKNVSGYLKPGQMCGVIAASDAGGTTLLDCLTGRLNHSNSSGRLSGSILVNGWPPNQDFRKIVGYCPKDDYNLALLTVEETLKFNSRLRLAQRLPPALVRFRHYMTLKIFNLSHVAQSLVGDASIRGLSGGERRRLTFALELSAGHSILIGNQVTNGLDSNSSLSLFLWIRAALSNGLLSFLTTIMQPSPELFDLFDTVLVLSKCASIYFGPRNQVIQYFESQGFELPPGKSVPSFLEELSARPEQFWTRPNLPLPIRLSPLQYAAMFEQLVGEWTQEPAKFSSHSAIMQRFQDMIQHTAAQSGAVTSSVAIVGQSSASSCRAAWARLWAGFENSIYNADLQFHLSRESNRIAIEAASAPPKQLRPGQRLKAAVLARSAPAAAPFSVQVRECVRRWAVLTHRNRGMWLGAWLRSCVVGLIIGSLFFDVGLSQSAIRTRVGLLYFLLTFISSSASQLISVLSAQRNVFNDQVEARYYQGFAYFLGYAAVQLPIAALESFFLILVVYGLANLTNGIGSVQFLFTFLCFWLFNLISRSVVLLITAITPNQLAAQALTGSITVLVQLFCGYLSPRALIPVGWRWMYSISYMTYALKGLAVNQFNHLDRLDCPAVGGCPYPTGPKALALYDMVSDDGTEWTCLWNLSVFYLAINLMAGLAMQLVAFKPAVKEEKPNFHDDETIEQTEDEEMKLLGAGDRSPSPTSGASSLGSSSGTVLCWRHVSYDVSLPDGSTKRLLNDCFGYVTSSGLTALMGSSGAGKTTLMDCVAGKKTTGEIRGELFFNGARLPFSRGAGAADDAESLDLSHEFGYVEQFDSLEPFSSVREAIEFSARLRCPRSWSSDQIARQIEFILHVLELESIQHEMIGDAATGGITPENRKKVMIAMELVTAPKVLFADEPTTSLTSHQALSLARALHRLSRSMAVCVTIHQPNSEIVALFDNLLLFHSGEVAYFGPMGSVVQYFSAEQTLAPPPEQHRNITDFALQVLNRAKAEKIDVIGRFRNSPRFTSVWSEVNRLCGCDSQSDAYQPWAIRMSDPVSSTLAQFVELFFRFFRIQLRDLIAIRTRLGLSIWMSFICGTLFSQLGTDQLAANSRFSCVFMIVSFITGLAMVKMPENFIYRSLYFRERTGAFYGAGPLVIARWLADLPMVCLETFVFTVMVYFIANLSTADHGLRFAALYFVMIGTRLTAIQLIAALSSLVPTIEMGAALVSVSITLSNLFSGFIIAAEAIPRPWIWMHFLSFMRYPLFFAVQNEMSAQSQFTCSPGQLTPVQSAAQLQSLTSLCPDALASLPLSNSSIPSTYLQCPLNCGNQLLNALGVSTSFDDRLLNGGLVYLFTLGFLAITYLGTKYINHIKR